MTQRHINTLINCVLSLAPHAASDFLATSDRRSLSLEWRRAAGDAHMVGSGQIHAMDQAINFLIF